MDLFSFATELSLYLILNKLAEVLLSSTGIEILNKYTINLYLSLTVSGFNMHNSVLVAAVWTPLYANTSHPDGIN